MVKRVCRFHGSCAVKMMLIGVRQKVCCGRRDILP